ncbi:hypothetical protein FGIG_02796 [Fasciola gigantica]|uniref:Protein quiver n=1 Tax=Fasciola gigantica TaxID=46835 RepID=A0A504ZC23_FASGI|nr:hypothetical protein FGIG_02796 [Fasciola gigantica]
MMVTQIWLTLLPLLLFLIVCNFIHQTHGIQCYECNSFEQEACDSMAPNALRPITCAPGAESCLKLKQGAPFRADPIMNRTSKTRILRACNLVPLAEFGEGCIERVGTQKVSLTYCVCTGEMCNPAPPQSRPRFGLISSLVSTFLLVGHHF